MKNKTKHSGASLEEFTAMHLVAEIVPGIVWQSGREACLVSEERDPFDPRLPLRVIYAFIDKAISIVVMSPRRPRAFARWNIGKKNVKSILKLRNRLLTAQQ